MSYQMGNQISVALFHGIIVVIQLDIYFLTVVSGERGKGLGFNLMYLNYIMTSAIQ